MGAFEDTDGKKFEILYLGALPSAASRAGSTPNVNLETVKKWVFDKALLNCLRKWKQQNLDNEDIYRRTMEWLGADSKQWGRIHMSKLVRLSAQCQGMSGKEFMKKLETTKDEEHLQYSLVMTMHALVAVASPLGLDYSRKDNAKKMSDLKYQAAVSFLFDVLEDLGSNNSYWQEKLSGRIINTRNNQDKERGSDSGSSQKVGAKREHEHDKYDQSAQGMTASTKRTKLDSSLKSTGEATQSTSSAAPANSSGKATAQPPRKTANNATAAATTSNKVDESGPLFVSTTRPPHHSSDYSSVAPSSHEATTTPSSSKPTARKRPRTIGGFLVETDSEEEEGDGDGDATLLMEQEKKLISKQAITGPACGNKSHKAKTKSVHTQLSKKGKGGGVAKDFGMLLEDKQRTASKNAVNADKRSSAPGGKAPAGPLREAKASSSTTSAPNFNTSQAEAQSSIATSSSPPRTITYKGTTRNVSEFSPLTSAESGLLQIKYAHAQYQLQQRDGIVAAQNEAIKKRDETIGEQQAGIKKVEQTIKDHRNALARQNDHIEQDAELINRHEATIQEQNKEIAAYKEKTEAQDKEIVGHKDEIDFQSATIKGQENKLKKNQRELLDAKKQADDDKRKIALLEAKVKGMNE